MCISIVYIKYVRVYTFMCVRGLFTHGIPRTRTTTEHTTDKQTIKKFLLGQTIPSKHTYNVYTQI